jgi:SAM-dependent methyltransferase
LAPKNVSFYYANIEKPPFQKCSFDVVFCLEVLEHVDNPEIALAQCHRVLKGRGYLILSIPFNIFVHGAPNDFRRYTIYGLERLLRQVGFELVEYSIIGNIFLSVLNHLITYFGFKRSNRISRYFNSLIVLCLNAIGLTVVNLFSRPKSYQETLPTVNDRTHPLGYVLVARKKGKDAVDIKIKAEEVVVCPDCHSRLSFLKGKILCKGCGKSFGYYNRVAVLADKEMLHLEYEAEGKKVDF